MTTLLILGVIGIVAIVTGAFAAWLWVAASLDDQQARRMRDHE